ncbi:MAG: glycine cleavage system aminomethyltransferase GcvT [Armatimonadota bacterium]|nr:glycine cleavage system aminomethyltransferase GcvT [Armatimonadota bacterium]
MNATPLHDLHIKLGAKMIEFHGWQVPLTFGHILDEAKTVRQTAGLFDISHMGRIEISGAQALPMLQYLTTNDISRLNIGKGQYNLMLNDHGGIKDDLTVFQIEADKYLLVVNAINTDKDYQWLSDHKQNGISMYNITQNTSLFALQGPIAKVILAEVLSGIPEMRRFACGETTIAGAKCFISRTGYTGEDGYEIYCAASESIPVWEALMELGKPFEMALCGLGARDVLRTEAGYVLYGNEITENVNPIEAGLTRFVKLDKGDFIGRKAITAIIETGPDKSLIGVKLIDTAVPRSGAPITSGGIPIGEITSGTFSPAAGSGIGLGYVTTEKSRPGLEVEVILREKPHAGRLIAPPFYKREDGR